MQEYSFDAQGLYKKSKNRNKKEEARGFLLDETKEQF
jgi:hypothetical protein